ncbi:MAG: hypothetical protein SH857_13890 [Chitinophagales bacterium]|nr:hypothetical protein [Chitinophagales bacterium]
MTFPLFFWIVLFGCVAPASNQFADVISVEVSGREQAYIFSVGISSPDTGCDQYADWWEVITEDGALAYRRILAHSHAEEQPFVRSGGTGAISSGQTVIIRAHMNKAGYGGKAFKGSLKSGFTQVALEKDFAAALEKQDPLPDGCDF